MLGPEIAFAGIAGFASMVLIFFVVSLIALIWAIIDIANADEDTGYKIIWLLICLFLGIIGVLLYYFVGRNK